MSSIDHHEQAAITLPALIYYLFSTGLNASTRCLPWHVYGQLSLDAFLFVLWLAATAASNYDCSGLCSACATPGEEYYGGYYNVFVGSLTCPCAFGQYDPSLSKVKRALEGRATSSANLNTGKEFESASKIATKLGFHALMMYASICTFAPPYVDNFIASSSQALRPPQSGAFIKQAKRLPFLKVMDLQVS